MSSEGGISPLRRSMLQLRHDRVALGAAAFVVVLVAVALLSHVWTPYPPNEQFVTKALAGPSWQHWLGSDDLGRDVSSRLMVGAGVSLRVAFQVVLMALAIAVPFGLLAGYKGGLVDNSMMRFLDAMTSVPALVLAIAIAGVLGPGVGNSIIALTIILIPVFARLVRAQALAVSAESFVSASRSVGSRTPRILFTRVLPGVVPALSVQISLALGTVLTADAALSFLGLGVPPPGASWGESLQRAYGNLFVEPSGVLPPAILIALTVLSFNILGDSIRDALGVGVQRRVRKRARFGFTMVDRRPDEVAAVDGGARTTRDVASGNGSGTEPRPLLAVRDLRVGFDAPGGLLTVLDGVSFDVGPGEIVGLVGESGSGKTVTALSMMRLLASPPGVILGGSVEFEGTDLLSLSPRELRKVRGADISMVFQNPMSSLDPTMTIGRLLGEAVTSHQQMSARQVRDRAVELLTLVGIREPSSRLKDYPHQFSGGMRQRVMIAMALAGAPKLLVADEPTTALDVTVQAQIMELLSSLREQLGMAILLVTHDLGVVADVCDRVAVMYAGRIVEQATAGELYGTPQHPYTEGLLLSVPSLTERATRLRSIPGAIPGLDDMPPGCSFHPRCEYAKAECSEAPIAMFRGHDAREVRCIRAAELTLRGTSS